MDVERRDLFAHLDDGALRRATDRWMTGYERAWCARQRSRPEALAVLLSCKEAVYKAWPDAGAVHHVSLEPLEGSPANGQARAGRHPVVIGVTWERWRDQVVALAMAWAERTA
jgi:phosphopantetheinyl transferase (holo-ACP synthase)